MATRNTTTYDIVGWQTGPKDRGTATLIWGCVTTIFACSWTILHLNVPAMTDSAWTRFMRKTKWMVITIVFPEFILSKAICDLRLALRELCEFDEYLQSGKNNVKWRTPHSLGGRSWEDEWSWTVDYPRHARWLYRLLFLKPPRGNSGERLSLSNRRGSQSLELNNLASSEEDQEREDEGTDRPWLHRLPFLKPPRGNGGEESPLPNISNTQRSYEEEQEQEQDDEGTDSPQNSTTGPKHNSELQAIDSSGPQMAPRLERRTQTWTIAHSYFAQMGGLAYIDLESKTHDYIVLTASKLTLRYVWLGNPPLEHLVLGKEDIEDKSKADSFVKAIAVLQIAWLVLNVIARAMKKLPITQLEIATIAFAVMAILTYAINWWKPKDISQPIRLSTSRVGHHRSSTYRDVELMQSFMTRLRRPHKAAAASRGIENIKRVPNDLVWMEGQIPLFYHLLGISSLVFGSLHCIAWKFEFPTWTELLCWRVASLLSAILPGITLGLSIAMGQLRADYLARKRIALLLHNLQPLESITGDRWTHLFSPRFKWWKEEVKTAFMAMPKDPNTNWEAEPSENIVKELKDSQTGRDISREYSLFTSHLSSFASKWLERDSREYQDHFGEHWFLDCEKIARLFKYPTPGSKIEDFWRGYESFVDKKLGEPSTSRPGTSFIDIIIKAYEEVDYKVSELNRRLDLATRVVEGLNVYGGMIYLACRLMTIVLLFTCLRAAPAGVYQVFPWTAFIPGIS